MSDLPIPDLSAFDDDWMETVAQVTSEEQAVLEGDPPATVTGDGTGTPLPPIDVDQRTLPTMPDPAVRAAGIVLDRLRQAGVIPDHTVAADPLLVDETQLRARQAALDNTARQTASAYQQAAQIITSIQTQIGSHAQLLAQIASALLACGVDGAPVSNIAHFLSGASNKLNGAKASFEAAAVTGAPADSGDGRVHLA